jgi:hypothetical protein
MNWTLYLISQFDTIRLVVALFAAAFLILAALHWVHGGDLVDKSSGNLEDPRFVLGQTYTHKAYWLFYIGLALVFIFTVTPSSHNACKAATAVCTWK